MFAYYFLVQQEFEHYPQNTNQPVKSLRQDELEQIKADDELGIEVCEPKAVVVQHLELPEKCQERTARNLEEEEECGEHGKR